MFVEITRGESAGETIEVSDEKFARLIAAGVAKEADAPKEVAKAIGRAQEASQQLQDASLLESEGKKAKPKAKAKDTDEAK